MFSMLFKDTKKPMISAERHPILNIAVEQDDHLKINGKKSVQNCCCGRISSRRDFDVTNIDSPERNTNDLLEDPNNDCGFDMRNHYESEIGFTNAIKPDVDTFRRIIAHY
jgi:predicted sulfurtransferase